MEEYIRMQELEGLLNKALVELKTRGFDYANAYKNYRVLLAKKLLELKADGMPVTIAYDIARGDPEVAEYKRQEIIGESLYKSSQEAINSYKLQIKILQEQINKDYSKNI